MSFAPIVPFSGNAGWAFLQRTRESQQEAFETAPQLKRNVAAFEERIAGITSAEELVADRALLEVALGAFGLDEDINNRFLITQILTSDLSDPKSLAMRFNDNRYQAISKAFGFGDTDGPRIADEGFAARITEAYQTRQFEVAVGESDQSMRLALGFERELAQINDGPKMSDNSRWFSVMATPPLRNVLETALGLPKSFGTLNLDRQLEVFRERAERTFGVSEVADFADPEVQSEVIRLYLARAQIAEGLEMQTSGSGIALQLLSS